MANLKEKIKNLNKTPDTTARFSPEDIQKNKSMAVLSYLGILVLIPLFAAKRSPYARYHCNQGLILSIAELILTVALSFMTRIRYIGWTFYPVSGAVGVVGIILMIIGIVNASKGRAKELPLLGDFRILKESAEVTE